MSWIHELYNTYERCNGNKNIADSDELCPVGYSMQNAHIKIVVDEEGNFLTARLVQKIDRPKTFIPVTESSSGRTSGEDPHPLCDSLQYCAKDYPQFGGARPSYFNTYIANLQKWAQSEHSHPKVRAIYEYVNKGTVIKDLVKEKLLAVENGILVVDRKGSNPSNAPIMKLLTYDDKGQKDQGKVFIRWIVQSLKNIDPCEETWTDLSLFDAWRNYLNSQETKEGFCYASGVMTAIAQKHPAKLRNAKDGAKLISSNDKDGYTFRGRFEEPEQAVSLSAEITQKAHSALRWLIGRKQAYRNEDQVFIAWETSGSDIPPLCANSHEMLGKEEKDREYQGDVGQEFANRFKNRMRGYGGKISDANSIVVMGLDSAVTGRMAITFYRELRGSEFLARIERWHIRFSWIQDYGKDMRFIGTPAPRDIGWAAYGKAIEGKKNKLMKATVERILPCIIDEAEFPLDILRSTVNRVSNRVGFKHWEWEKCLGITCALYKGFYQEEKFTMALDETRTTRDYLYGRLLAIADVAESVALSIMKENRDTNAARLMQHFSDHPYSTWRTLEEGLKPYMDRIYPGLSLGYKELLDIILHDRFDTQDFINNSRLSGEYLLGYHCQRRWLKLHKRKDGQWIDVSEQAT